MTATFFTGLNIFSWNRWTVFAIAFGPCLVWIYTAIYSIIPPSSFATGVYGNDDFLFRSAAYWFGWPFVTVIALLPRYLNKTFQQNIVPDDVDTMRLVREYQPGVDLYSHPMLGGKLREESKKNQEAQGTSEGELRNGEIAMKEMGSSAGTSTSANTYTNSMSPTYPPPKRSSHEGPFGDHGDGDNDLEANRPGLGPERVSMSSSRNRFGMHASGRGSAVDSECCVSPLPLAWTLKLGSNRARGARVA